MAFIHGSKAKFSLGTVGTPATLVDISAYLNSVGLPRQVDSAESSTLGNTFKTYVPGLSDSTLSLDGRYDPTIDAQLAGLIGAATVNWQFDPQGTSTGLPRFTGSAFLVSYQVSAEIGNISAFTAQFQCITAVTRAVQ